MTLSVHGLRLAHVVTSIADEASGPAYSVPRLAAAQAEMGSWVSLLSVGVSNKFIREGVQFSSFAQDFGRVPVLSKLMFSRGLWSALRDTVIDCDVVHCHGIWRMPNVYPAAICKDLGKPLLFSPRGMLSPSALRYSPASKLVFWSLAQRAALHYSTCLHATSENELRDIRARGLRHPVAVIPNGIHLASSQLKAPNPPGAPRTFLYLGRLHPLKGLSRLLEAWKIVEDEQPGWRLRIVGPSENGHGEELAELAVRNGIRGATIEGPLFGEDKGRAYAAADIFVMPTTTENFGMTVAESLAHGTPVICTKGAPWAGLVAEGCGWWIDRDAKLLAETMLSAGTLPDEVLRNKGDRGRQWMLRSYDWRGVAETMNDVYCWMLDRSGARPDCIHMD